MVLIQPVDRPGYIEEKLKIVGLNGVKKKVSQYSLGMKQRLAIALALVGAVIGFFWYNTYPAQVFMGDTGSLMLGGVIAVLAIILRKELLIPVLCGIFLVENLSVMLQVVVFKYRKRKYGLEYAQNNRLFLMSPLHHHYQKKGYHESKIVNRAIILGMLLAIICLITLKTR